MADYPGAAGILPKEEVGASAFIKQHPEFDGRGVIVGVFDTGVDVGAAGLQTCSDGRPKLIDFVDCTGSGDVDTSTALQLGEGGALKGLSGRALRVPAAWPAAKGGEYRVGLKAGYELFPGPLVARLKKERRAAFDEAQRAATSEAVAAVAAFAAKGGKGEGAKKAQAELKARVELLATLGKAHVDVGPLVYPCSCCSLISLSKSALAPAVDP